MPVSAKATVECVTVHKGFAMMMMMMMMSSMPCHCVGYQNQKENLACKNNISVIPKDFYSVMLGDMA